MAKQKPTEQGMGSNNNFNDAEVKGKGDEEKIEEPVTNSQRGVDQEKNDLTKLSSLKLRDRTSVLSNEINTLRSEIKEFIEREKELKEDCDSLRKQQVEALEQVGGEKTNNVTNINNMKKIIKERYDELISKNEKERNGILAEIKAKESEINKKEEERKNIWGEVDRRDVANKAAEKLKIGDPDFSSEMVKNLIKEFARIVKGNDRGEPNDSDEETANNDKSSQPVTDQQEAVANKAAEELKIGDPDFLREMVKNQIKEFNRIVKENDGKKLNDSDEEREQAVNSDEQREKVASETGSDGDTNPETETNKELSLEEWRIVWDNDKKLYKEIVEILNRIDENKEPEKYRENYEVADALFHIFHWDSLMERNKKIDSDIFNEARLERAKCIDRIEKILYPERFSASAESDSGAEERVANLNTEKPGEEVQTEGAASEPVHEEGEPHVHTEAAAPVDGNSASGILRERVVRKGLKPKDGTSVDEAAAGGSDSGADERTPEADRAKEPDAEEGEVGGSETEEKATGDEEKAETEKPAKKTEAEILYQKDLYKLKEKEGILNKCQDVQAVLEKDYKAATRRFMDRTKRARCSYEMKKAEAQEVRASIEIKRLKEIVGVSAKMIDAEKKFGADSEQYIEAKNERERLYKLYQGYIDEVGEVQGIDRNKKGIIKDGDQRGRDRLNLKPAKPSKLKAFWNKIKKSFVAFVVGSVIGAGITGLALGINNSGKERVDDPNTNTPIEQPADDSKDNELVDEIDKNFDTGSLTDEDKQQIEDKIEEVGSITSMVKVEGVEGVSYRKDGDVDKVNIYITTQAGLIIEYQTQVTKDEVSELATTEGVTAKDVVDLILSDVSKNTPSASYKKIDEAKYGQLINNICSDAEDIEFPEPGKDGNYTSFYFKIDNTRNEKEDVGNVDFLAIGPDSVVKVDDRVEYQTSTGEKLDLRDPSALLNMIERSLGGNASTSGFSGKIETKFNSTSYFQSHKDENSQVEEAEAIQNIMDEAVAKTEKELSNDELTR